MIMWCKYGNVNFGLAQSCKHGNKSSMQTQPIRGVRGGIAFLYHTSQWKIIGNDFFIIIHLFEVSRTFAFW